MRTFNIKVNGVSYEVEVEEVNGAAQAAAPVAQAAPAAAPAPKAPAAPKKAAPAAVGAGTKVNAPMPGTILDVKVSVGGKVKKGDILMILEAMKMENEIIAAEDGTVAQVLVQKGSTVGSGDVLCVLN